MEAVNVSVSVWEFSVMSKKGKFLNGLETLKTHVKNIFATNLVVLSLIENSFTNKTIEIAHNNRF